MDTTWKILVVDDEPAKRELISLALGTGLDGCEVVTAYDGESGLAAVAAHQPDLIVTDAMMPGMDGYEMIRRLRSDPKTRFIPVIIQSATRIAGQDVRLGAEVGAMGYLTDPTDIDLMVNHARTLLDFKKHLTILESRAAQGPAPREGSVVAHFDFPEEVRVPCEQYLLYFVQFLKDLGVEATSELNHDAGHVLFAVTPSNREEALDNIRVALDAYLGLAASPVDIAISYEHGIEVQRLASEIQSLHSRLMLARAEIQMKDATIEAKQFIIDRQKLLGGEVMVDSVRQVVPQPAEDKEEIFGGIVEITKYKGKGVNVNYAEVFRRLKKLFSRRGDESSKTD